MKRTLFAIFATLILLAGAVHADEKEEIGKNIIQIKNVINENIQKVQQAIDQAPPSEDTSRQQKTLKILINKLKALDNIVISGQTVDFKAEFSEQDKYAKGKLPEELPDLPIAPAADEVEIYYPEDEYSIFILPLTQVYSFKNLDEGVAVTPANVVGKIDELSEDEPKMLSIDYLIKTIKGKDAEFIFEWEYDSDILEGEKEEEVTKGLTGSTTWSFKLKDKTYLEVEETIPVKLKVIYDDTSVLLVDSDDELAEFEWRLKFIKKGEFVDKYFDKKLAEGEAWLANKKFDEAMGAERVLNFEFVSMKAEETAKYAPKYEKFKKDLITAYIKQGQEYITDMNNAEAVRVEETLKKDYEKYISSNPELNTLFEEFKARLKLIKEGKGKLEFIVKDTDGKDVSNVNVELFDGKQVKTGNIANGKGEITNVSAGEYLIKAIGADYETAEYNVKLGAGEVKVINIIIVSKSKIKGAVEGQVFVDEVAQKVGLKYKTKDKEKDVSVDDLGKFKLEGLEAGNYKIYATEEGKYTSESKVEFSIAEKEKKLVIVQLTSIDSSKGWFEGFVKDEKENIIPGANIEVQTAPDLLLKGTTISTATGYTTGKVAAGKYRLTALKAGYIQEQRFETAYAGIPTKDVNFVLKKEKPTTGTVEGVVKFKDGRPVERVDFLLYDDESVLLAEVNPAGDFRIQEVTPKSYLGRVTSSKFKIKDVEPKLVEVKAGETTIVETIELEVIEKIAEKTSIFGRVVDKSTGKGINPIKLTIKFPDGTIKDEVSISTDNGVFFYVLGAAEVQLGEYTLMISADRYESKRDIKVKVEAAGKTQLPETIELAVLIGRVITEAEIKEIDDGIRALEDKILPYVNEIDTLVNKGKKLAEDAEDNNAEIQIIVNKLKNVREMITKVKEVKDLRKTLNTIDDYKTVNEQIKKNNPEIDEIITNYNAGTVWKPK